MNYRLMAFLTFQFQITLLRGSTEDEKTRITLVPDATTAVNAFIRLKYIETTSNVPTSVSALGTTESNPSPTKSPTTTTSTPNTSTSRSDYITPHRVQTQLEEKLQTLSCDLPALPNESRLWKGNETHELLLPAMVSLLLIFRVRGGGGI